MSGAVRDKDNGYAALMKTVADFGAPQVAVGILAKDANLPEAGGATVLQVGIWNEFGTDRIPSRSFIRAWFDASQAERNAVITKLMKAVVAGRLTKAQALEQLGLWAQGQVQARIAAGIGPANAPATMKRKGSATPLIASGQLRSAISYGVRDK